MSCSWKKEEILLSFAWLMKINLSFFVDCDVIMLWWKWDYLMNFSQWSTLRMCIPYFWTKSCGKCVDFKVKIFLNSTKMSNFQIDTVGLMRNASDKKKIFQPVNISISVYFDANFLKIYGKSTDLTKYAAFSLLRCIWTLRTTWALQFWPTWSAALECIWPLLSLTERSFSVAKWSETWR